MPRPIALEYPHWTLVHGLLNPDLYDVLLEGVKDKVATYTMQMYGKTFEVKKKSCVFTNTEMKENVGKVDAKSKGFNYDNLPVYSWEEAPAELLDIKTKLDKTFGHEVDYVLVHLPRSERLYRVAQRQGSPRERNLQRVSRVPAQVSIQTDRTPNRRSIPRVDFAKRRCSAYARTEGRRR